MRCDGIGGRKRGLRIDYALSGSAALQGREMAELSEDENRFAACCGETMDASIQSR